jgi:hypothetical protein
MARVALGGSLRNSGHVRKLKEQPGTHTISFIPRRILTVVRTAALLSQTVDVSPSCQAHSGLREPFIARQSVPFLLTTL